MKSTILFEFSWIATTTCTLLILYVYFIKPYLERQRVPEGKRRVPQVEGCLPIIGHAFHFFSNEIDFMKTCYEKYGGVFQIKIFFAKIVVVCDRNLVMTYLKEKESILSFFHAMNDLNFDWTLFETGVVDFKTASSIFKKGVSYKTTYLLSKVEEEAVKVVQGIKSFCKNGIYNCILNTEMNSFILHTSFACFSPIPLNENVSKDLMRLFTLSDHLIMAAYVVPKWILKLAWQWRIRQLRRNLSQHFAEEIQKYIDDPNKCETNLVRLAVDCGVKLTSAEIAEIIMCFIYVSATNTSIALSNVLSNLALPENAIRLEKIRKECQKSVGDVSKIICAPLLNGFIMETARLSAQIMALQRMVVNNRQFCLGDYFIENEIRHLALSPIMLQVYGNSFKDYHDPTKFIPERFIGNEAESQTWPNIISWGGGVHACPGKSFAISQIKIILSHLLLNFDFKVDQKLGPFNYFAVVAFGQRSTKCEITERKFQD